MDGHVIAELAQKHFSNTPLSHHGQQGFHYICLPLSNVWEIYSFYEFSTNWCPWGILFIQGFYEFSFRLQLQFALKVVFLLLISCKNVICLFWKHIYIFVRCLFQICIQTSVLLTHQHRTLKNRNIVWSVIVKTIQSVEVRLTIDGW